MSGAKGIDEKTAFEERDFVYRARVMHQTWGAIRVAFEDRFERIVAVNTLQRRYKARLEEIREEESGVKVVDRRQAHRDRLDALARYWLEMTSHEMIVENPDTGKPMKVIRPISQKINAGIQYRGVLQDLAKLDGLNAPERTETTVVHTVEMNPLVSQMIAESRKRIGQRKAPDHEHEAQEH